MNDNALLRGLAIAFGTVNADIVHYNAFANANQYWIMNIQFDDAVRTVVSTKVYGIPDLPDVIQKIKDQMNEPKLEVFAITLQ